MNNDKILRLIPNFRFTDEYERQQLLHDYARFSPWIFWGSLIVGTLDFFINSYLGQLPALGILTYIFILIYSVILVVSLRKKKVDTLEVHTEAQYKIQLKKLHKSSLLFATIMFIIFNLNYYWIPFVTGSDLPHRSDILTNLLTTLIIALITGFVVYGFAKSKLIKTYKDNA
ncbi:hypothetical protein [Staphylococcus edaphicus]|uniref:DUF3278 domain-containing protein n=1 Tax=Staphylococcus edaphicus TaxID=1955013 RepID=A0A2C6WPD3_9STAP|nr:hypothetical protein [Staphylococcus edaphicus]PHK49993.1 hypothetical protein BTJ66_05665 [Staphylococcus edaphicus]UQW81746.1 hypothetical protein MNY58_01130 [Staphylococcus edaphicus]